MRIPLPEFLQKLGVSIELSPYETFPWSCSDAMTGKTCSAEVRMNPDGDELEAEIQIILDQPEPGQPAVQQMVWFKGIKAVQDKWDMTQLRIKREDWVNKVYAWDEKACNLFRACVVEIEQGRIPDFDALIEREMHDKEKSGGYRGAGGGKSPKIRPQQLLDMKKGQGF
ncbi:MAG: hypothetical protein WC043_10270 [Pseudobdellovibrionaceae bacterium]